LITHKPPRTVSVSDRSRTFSIVAYDPETGDYGVAVQSKYFAVGDIVPFAKADTRALATQARGNLRYGPEGLKLINAEVARGLRANLAYFPIYG
jgi:uncharacterized Ntn-hydrolase superfamily protein